jgi:hypothetical protein
LEQQAASFAAVNSNLTAMTPMQLHAARLVAGDEQAALLAEVCASAGVSILRHPMSVANMKVGETMAAGQLRNFLGRYGKDILGVSLRCITKTGDGNPGMVRAPIVHSLCSVFDSEPPFIDDEKMLLRAMEKFNFMKQLEKAQKSARMSRAGLTHLLVDAIAEHLDRHLGSNTA